MSNWRYYRALFEGDDTSGWGVVFPDFPGCVSAGDTFVQAHANAQEALDLHVTGMVSDGEPLPLASMPDDPLPAWLERELWDGPAVGYSVQIPSPSFLRLNISLDENLVRQIDRAAADRGSTRSGWLADAARKALDLA